MISFNVKKSRCLILNKEEKKLLKLEKKNQKLNKEEQKEEKKLEEYNLNRPKRIKKEKKKAEYRIINEAPKRSLLEEIGNAVSHGLGAIFSIIALILMLSKSKTGLEITSSIIYGVCMFLTMINSCLYHAFKYGSKVKRIWRRFDYSAIYLLIGGTFAPLFLMFLEKYNSPLAITLFILQWIVIIFGITMNGVFGPGRIKILNYILYFAVGWSGIVFIPFFINYNITLLIYILVGGIVYTLGMIPFAFKQIKVTHFIFHLVILIACIIQFSGIYICLFC